MNVLHLGKFYPPAPGGMETHLQTLARTQAACGLNVRVLCVNHADVDGQDVTWSRWANTPDIIELDGPVEVHRLGRRASLARLDFCPHLWKTLRSIAYQDVDLLHLHTPNPTMLLSLVVTGIRCPLVITHHSDVIRQKFLRHLVAPFDRMIYRQAARIFPTSPVYADGSWLLKGFREKLTPIPLGIDLEPFLNPSAKALESCQNYRKQYGEPLWLCVGRMNYYKGISVALEALREVPGKLVVIGTGPFVKEWQELASRLRVNQRVIWRGHADLDEVVGAYHAATAFWFPSNARSEAYGLVQIEAMASACPIINTAIPHSGVPWVSPHEKTGLTIPMNDPSALARAATRLWEDKDFRRHLGDQGRQRAIEEFDQMKMAERTIAVYREVTGKS